MSDLFSTKNGPSSLGRRALTEIARRTQTPSGRARPHRFNNTNAGPPLHLKVAVAVASVGRPHSVASLLDRLARQTTLPHQVVLSVESDNDLPPERDLPFAVTPIFGPRGLAAQRNRALLHLDPDSHIVVFYDDDFVPSRFALAGISAFFSRYPDVAGADGLVVADGIIGPGLSPEAAEQIIDRHDKQRVRADPEVFHEVTGLYGCNMAYRLSAIEGLQFDERLPLYGWLEDLDFSGRVRGTLVRTNAFAGVHCGEKRGRESNGTRLGYSQIANPLYMLTKGSISPGVAAFNVARTFAANHLKLVRPEPWVDRRGRVAGNWLAVRDVMRGTVEPTRIVRL